jgi:hypothetical protein
MELNPEHAAAWESIVPEAPPIKPSDPTSSHAEILHGVAERDGCLQHRGPL